MSDRTARSGGPGDRFEQAYAAGLVEEDPELVPRAPRGRARREEAIAEAAPAEPFALRGCVLTPERVIQDGYVVLGRGKTISAV